MSLRPEFLFAAMVGTLVTATVVNGSDPFPSASPVVTIATPPRWQEEASDIGFEWGSLLKSQTTTTDLPTTQTATWLQIGPIPTPVSPSGLPGSDGEPVLSPSPPGPATLPEVVPTTPADAIEPGPESPLATPMPLPLEPAEPLLSSFGSFARSSNLTGAFAGSLSAAPGMIGDTTSGSCGVVRFEGGLPVVSVQHPTFACSRLNISENNSALVRDRIYLSYRHFENASEVSVFADFDGGDRASQNIDRFTFAIEKKLCEVASLEVRIPVNLQLSSDLQFSQTTGPPGGSAIIDLPLQDIDGDLGNIALIWKTVFIQGDQGIWSGGLALNLPTAPDVRLQGEIDDERFVIQDPTGATADQIVDLEFFFDANIRNRLINLSPFTAMLIPLGSKNFVQGFAQLDLPIRPLEGSVRSQLRLPGFGVTLPEFDEAGDIDVQKLLRASVGVGRRLHRSPRGSVTGLVELHYTTTIEDDNSVQLPVLPRLGSLIPATDVEVGNISNRTDILNLVAGLAFQRDRVLMTHGVAMPLRESPDRGFDFEYNLLLSRSF